MKWKIKVSVKLKKQKGRDNDTKYWYFEKINLIDKSLSKGEKWEDKKWLISEMKERTSLLILQTLKGKGVISNIYACTSVT